MAQSSENGRSSEQWGTRVQPDVNTDLHEYREAKDLSKAEALRRLAQLGLKKRDPVQQWAHDLKLVSDHMASMGVIAFVATAFWPTGGLMPALIMGLAFGTVSATGYLIQHYLRVHY